MGSGKIEEHDDSTAAQPVRRSSNQAWRRQPSSVDRSDFQNDQAEPGQLRAATAVRTAFAVPAAAAVRAARAISTAAQWFRRPTATRRFRRAHRRRPGFGAPGGYPYPVPTHRQTDGFSIASFVLGLIAIFPLGFVFGIVGLVRTEADRRRGRWMAVARHGAVGGLGRAVGRRWRRYGERPARSPVRRRHGHQEWPDLAVGPDGSAIAASSRRIGHARLRGTITVSLRPTAQCPGDRRGADCPVRWLPRMDDPRSRQARIVQPARKPAFIGRRPHPAELGVFVLIPRFSGGPTDDHVAHCLLLDPDKDITGDIRADR